MSRIEDLVEELAPNGVRLELLGDIATIGTGSHDTKDAVSDGEYEFYARGREPLRLDSFDFEERAIITAGDGVGVGKVFHFADGPYALHQRAYRIVPHEGIDARYVYHYLVADFARYLAGISVHASVTSLRRPMFLRYQIPIPPMEVQHEIVRLIDEFHAAELALESALYAELAARSNQCAMLRDQLLAFDDSTRLVPLGDIARIVRGASPRPIKSFITTSADGIPWIKIGDVPAGSKYIVGAAERVTPEGAAKSRRVYPGDFVLSNSMSLGRPYISKIEGCIHDGWLAIGDFRESFIPDFLYYLLRSNGVQSEFSKRAGSGTVQNLNADIVRSVVVPVPSLEDQEHIVRALDELEPLANRLMTSITAELEARRKQYEYYRDKLLTFRENA